MTAVDTALTEATAKLREMKLPHEGLRDIAATNIQPETRVVVTHSIGLYDRRKQLIEAWIDATKELLNDGYSDAKLPEIPEVPLEAFRDIQEQTSSVASASALFRQEPAPATTLNLSSGATQPKAE